jgi:twinkle protein
LHDVGAFEGDVLRLYRGQSAPAVSTGWSALDPLYKVRAGELTVVTGVPNSGKSQFIDALMMNLAEYHGWRFAVCSFENPPSQHVAKLAEILKRAPFHDGPTPRMTEADVSEAMAWLQDQIFFIRADDESPTIDWILDTARAAVLRHGIRGLVIDPYNEIEHRRERNQTETEYVSEILSKVKRFAQAHGVHVWFVAHPAKLYRDRTDGTLPVPSLYDISGSANWVNKADVGIVIERDWETSKVMVHVKKVRWKETGRIGTATLDFDRVTGRYIGAVSQEGKTTKSKSELRNRAIRAEADAPVI